MTCQSELAPVFRLSFLNYRFLSFLGLLEQLLCTEAEILSASQLGVVALAQVPEELLEDEVQDVKEVGQPAGIEGGDRHCSQLGLPHSGNRKAEGRLN